MRLVIKIGTQSLLNDDRALDTAMIQALIRQIVALKKAGHAVVLVSSGAVGAGRGLWHSHHRKMRLADPVLEKQILASLGQAHLIHSYNEALLPHGMMAAQLLFTTHDFRAREYFVNGANLLAALLEQKSVLPVINENDSVAVEELMFTDNDQLSGLIAAQVNADKLIMMTNVDGVYDPQTKETIRTIALKDGWPALEQGTSAGGRGGMQSKLDTAFKMAKIGVATHIVRARDKDILPRLMKGEEIGTAVLPAKKPVGKKRWLAVHLEKPQGAVVVNDCLCARLKEEKGEALSILPVGVTAIVRSFGKGELVELLDEKGRIVGRGEARYDAARLKEYMGQSRKPPLIHYDALLLEEG